MKRNAGPFDLSSTCIRLRNDAWAEMLSVELFITAGEGAETRET